MAGGTFDDIFGQAQAIGWLEQAYLADHLPHAMIFAGPAGVGKGTTATALAKLFLCEKPEKARPCGVCEGCRTFHGGNHPDYHIISKEHIRYHDKTGKSKGIDLSIHVIRPELLEPASRKAAMRVAKIFIVEQAELMNAQAQNSMLKTLEEPYGRTLIILLTDQPAALLPTIRSRCQTVRFAALDEGAVQKELVKRGIAANAAKDAAGLARGSLGVALKWIEDGVIGPARSLTTMIDGLFEGHAPQDLPGWFKTAAEAYAEKQLERDELSSKDQATREGLTLYILLAGEHIRRRLAGGGNNAEIESSCSAIDALVQAETFLDSNVNTSLVLQQLAMKLEGK